MSECLFCQPDDPNLNTVAARSGTAYARLDNFPLAEWHVDIVPFRHVGSFFDLTKQELLDIWDLARILQKHLYDPAPDGYTIGINDGPAAGQTIPHMHLHIIPRRFGDVPNARGGIRRVFPYDAYSASGGTPEELCYIRDDHGYCTKTHVD